MMVLCRELLLQLDALLYRYTELQNAADPSIAALISDEFLAKVETLTALLFC